MLSQGRPDRRGAPSRARATAIATACSSRRSPARASRRSSQRIEEEFARTLREIELLIPYDEGGRLAELHEIAGDLEREETPDGVKVVARLPASLAGRYQPYALSGRS